jgi:hypothetical protein
MFWPDGRVYEGQWIDGLENGPGVLSLPDGKGLVAQEWNSGTLIFECPMDDI